MLSLPFSTTQVKINTGLFSVPVDTHYTAVTFQPPLKNLSSYAPFPEAGFPHKNLVGFKVVSTSTSAHLKSHRHLSFSFSLLPNTTHIGSSGALFITCPCIENFLESSSNICWAFCYWWFHKMTCNKLLRNTAAALNHCVQMNKWGIQLPISKESKISDTARGGVEAIKFSDYG